MTHYTKHMKHGISSQHSSSSCMISFVLNNGICIPTAF